MVTSQIFDGAWSLLKFFGAWSLLKFFWSMVIFQIMLEHIIIITRDWKEHRKWAGVRSNIDSAHFVPTGLSISYPISNHWPSSLKTENSLQNCTVKAMYTTGQYLKIMGGKGGMLIPDRNPVPPPLAKTCTLYLKVMRLS